MSAQAREFDFSDKNFFFLRDLARDQIGINLTESKRELIYSRISRRIRDLKLSDFDSYCGFVADDPQELVRFVNAVTTNLTFFFREPHHFEYLQNEFLAELAANHQQDRRVRIWSAGCSTGEEPYSLAMTLRDANVLPVDFDVKILATDVDSDVLARASRGVYPSDSRGLEKSHERRWFNRHADGIEVKPEVRELISFKQLNLMADWPMKGPFDIVFCRNVVIYFDKDVQRVLFERMANLMSPNSLLCLGHSESLFAVSERFELIGRTIYRKIR